MKFSILSGICLLLMSCTFNATSSNDYHDQEDAKKIANKLFVAQIEQNYTEADKLFSEEFHKVTPVEKMHKHYAVMSNKLGEFKSNKLLECKTKDIAGTNARTEYLCVYELVYEKDKAIVTLEMLREDAEEDIKIVRYHIESPAFLE